MSRSTAAETTEVLRKKTLPTYQEGVSEGKCHLFAYNHRDNYKQIKMAFQKIQSFCQWQPFFFKTRGWDIVSHLPKECRALQNNSLGHLTWSQWKDTSPIGSFCGGALMLETLCFQRQLNQVESELSVYFVIWGKNENSITKWLKFQCAVQQGWQSRLMGVLKQWFRNLRRLRCTSTASLHPVQLTHSLQTRIL